MLFFVVCGFFINFFKKNLSGIPSECQTVWIQIRYDICQAWSGSKLFAKVISRWQKLPLGGRELRQQQKFPSTHQSLQLPPTRNVVLNLSNSPLFARSSCISNLLHFFFVHMWFNMRHLVYLYLFLISHSFGASGGLFFMIVAFSGYLYLHFSTCFETWKGTFWYLISLR